MGNTHEQRAQNQPYFSACTTTLKTNIVKRVKRLRQTVGGLHIAPPSFWVFFLVSNQEKACRANGTRPPGGEAFHFLPYFLSWAPWRRLHNPAGIRRLDCHHQLLPVLDPRRQTGAARTRPAGDRQGANGAVFGGSSNRVHATQTTISALPLSRVSLSIMMMASVPPDKLVHELHSRDLRPLPAVAPAFCRRQLPVKRPSVGL